MADIIPTRHELEQSPPDDIAVLATQFETLVEDKFSKGCESLPFDTTIESPSSGVYSVQIKHKGKTTPTSMTSVTVNRPQGMVVYTVRRPAFESEGFARTVETTSTALFGDVQMASATQRIGILLEDGTLGSPEESIIFKPEEETRQSVISGIQGVMEHITDEQKIAGPQSHHRKLFSGVFARWFQRP